MFIQRPNNSLIFFSTLLAVLKVGHYIFNTSPTAYYEKVVV